MNELENLVHEFGYPLYIYKEEELRRRAGLLRYIFEDFSLFYSLKANPNKKIIAFLAGLGYGADCASAAEVELAGLCGVKKDDILYSAPGKTEEEIRDAEGRCIIVADSFGELERLNRYFKTRTEIGVRINPSSGFNSEKAFETMGGGPSKFGIDEEAFFRKLPEIQAYENISITGLHVYMGSGILDEKVIAGNFEIVFRIINRFGYTLRFADFGGGLGVPYEAWQKELDPDKLRKHIKRLADKYEPDCTRLITESGRYTVASCGSYITRITDVKESGGKKYYIIYGGMNGFFRPVFTGTKHRVTVHSDSKDMETATVAGHLCTPIDVTAENIEVRKGSAGDIVEVSDAGAYGFTMSLKEFISHRKPAEIYVSSDGKAERC